MNIEDIRNLAIRKKEELLKSGENSEKIDTILALLNDDMCFFKLDINIAIPILSYLGIEEKQLVDVYFCMISCANFKKGNKVRTAIDVNL